MGQWPKWAGIAQVPRLVRRYFQIHSLRMVGPSVFPDSRLEKSNVETHIGLSGIDLKSETTSKCILDILEYSPPISHV